METREDAVRKALEAFPGSIRTLASEAGVSEGLLRAIRDGRLKASPRTVGLLADALSRLAEGQTEAASILRKTLQRKEGA